VKTFLQHITEARDSLERRWRDINFAMAQTPQTPNPMAPFNRLFHQYEVDTRVAGNFPVKIKPFSLPGTAGPLGDWEYTPNKGGGVIRLDPANSTRISPVLWHELAHATQDAPIDKKLYGTTPKILTGKYANPKEVLAASSQRAVPYLIRDKEMDARAFEYGKTSYNEARRRLERVFQSTLKTAQELGPGAKIQPTSFELEGSKRYKDLLVKHMANTEKINIEQGLATPPDTPMETVFGGTRAPSEKELKIRAARSRQGSDLVKRGMQNAADMAALGYDDASSPAMIKSVMRQVKKRTGVKQFTPDEWAPMVALARMMRTGKADQPASKAASVKPTTVMGVPEPELPKPTDVHTRSISVSPKSTARRGAVSADTLATLGGVGGAVVGGMAAGAGAALDTMAGVLTPPTPKDRMYSEKMFNSDVGLGFDSGPDGELEANPAGFKAVRDRKARGVAFPTMFPPEQYKY
jgi:hypothetical protein